MDRTLLTIAEAATRLGLRPGTLRTQIGRGRLRAERRSARVVLIDAAEVERYRAEHLGTRQKGHHGR